MPNVGALGTRRTAAPRVRYHAFLGVWKDSDRDGDAGLAERSTEGTSA